MRVLLDECLPRRMAGLLTGHEVKTVPEMGWAGLKNGELLDRMASGFDAFVTIDQSLAFQQNVGRYPLFLIVLHAKSNRLEDIRTLIPNMLAVLDEGSPGAVLHVK